MMKTVKTVISLMLAAFMVFSLTAVSAKTFEPDLEIDRLAGAEISATVGAYDEESGTFTVTLYEYDFYDEEDIRDLAVGDTLLAGGRLYRIKGQTDLDGVTVFLCDGGEEIYFEPSAEDDDDLIARSTSDDRIFMHVITVLHLPAAEDIILEDFSDVDLDEPVITAGLEEILKIKAEKEETSNGLDYYATTITLSRDLEIVKIHQVFDVAQ